MNNFVDEFVNKQIKENAIKLLREEIQRYINMDYDKEEIEACYIGPFFSKKKLEYIPLVLLWVGRIYDEIMKEKR